MPPKHAPPPFPGWALFFWFVSSRGCFLFVRVPWTYQHTFLSPLQQPQAARDGINESYWAGPYCQDS